jgi:hypothetical protein
LYPEGTGDRTAALLRLEKYLETWAEEWQVKQAVPRPEKFPQLV